jgi:hypothetical protein
MMRKSAGASGGEPSFFYLMMAESCFQRAIHARHPSADVVLRNMARDYLAKATEVRSTFEPEPRPAGWRRVGS